MYSKAAEDEDNKMVDRWQKDAEGILFFVSLRIAIRLTLHINWNTVDWSILCRSCCTSCSDSSGPEAKQPGYLRILSWKHLSGSHRPKRNTLIPFFPYRQTTLILSFEICRLGEFSLVLEPCHEPELCTVGHIVTTMGTSISQSCSACAVQSRKASTDACILCRGRGQDAYFMGS